MCSEPGGGVTAGGVTAGDGDIGVTPGRLMVVVMGLRMIE